MTREEHAKFVAQCRELVLLMSRLEQRIGKLDEALAMYDKYDGSPDSYIQ